MNSADLRRDSLRPMRRPAALCLLLAGLLAAPSCAFKRLKADTAEKIGLVEEVVGKGESLERALALAEQVGEQSPTSVRMCKTLIHSARDKAIGDGLQGERDMFVDLFSTADQKEGVNAFLEKRKPEWKNA